MPLVQQKTNGKIGSDIPTSHTPKEASKFSARGDVFGKQTVRRKSIRYLNSSARTSEGCVQYESVDKKRSHIHVEWAGLVGC
ncbi:hypothetical protein ACKS0A_11442 [Histoplasma ohiense]